MKNTVFFSGGSALAETARELAARQEPVTYIITPFDSGGSTRALRKAFGIPAIGDIRNRLLAAADPALSEGRLWRFLKQRAPENMSAAGLYSFIAELEVGRAGSASAIRTDLDAFFAEMPPDFEAGNASIGNLALTGALLRCGCDFDAAIARYSGFLHLAAKILPVVDASLHIGAILQNGQVVVGQHRINRHIKCPVADIFLTRANPWKKGKVCGCRPPVKREAAAAIMKAELICIPMGSFYSSIIANFLPTGIGRALAKSSAKKVFIPNTGIDSELNGVDIADQAQIIQEILRRDAAGTGNFIDYALVDSKNGDYPGGNSGAVYYRLAAMGIKVIDVPVISSPGRHDPVALLAALEVLA